MVARRPSLPALIIKHPQQISISDKKPGLWQRLAPPYAHLPGHRFNPQRAVEAIPACRFGRVGFCVALQWHFASEAFSPEFSPYQQKLRAIHAPM